MTKNPNCINPWTYVNPETIERLCDTPEAKEILLTFKFEASAFTEVHEAHKLGKIPTHIYYGGYDPARIVEAIESKPRYHRAVENYKDAKDKMLNDLMSLQLISCVGDVFKKIDSGFSYYEQAMSFLFFALIPER
jgi:hypothetical protein